MITIRDHQNVVNTIFVIVINMQMVLPNNLFYKDILSKTYIQILKVLLYSFLHIKVSMELLSAMKPLFKYLYSEKL